MSTLSHERVVFEMQATGNSFVLLDERPARAQAHPDLARHLCDRETGFGVDGLLVVGADSRADASMRIFNADGSEAETCGNGLRCVARYLSDRDGRGQYTFATVTRPVTASVRRKHPFEAAIGMGHVAFPDGGRLATIEAAGATWSYVSVSVGNPHVVVFVRDVEAIDLERIGAAIARDARFPEGANVHVASEAGPNRLRVRHYERGVGLTQSCGSGAVACASAFVRAGRARAPIEVEVPGGLLRVEQQPDGEWILIGPAEPVAERTIAL